MQPSATAGVPRATEGAGLPATFDAFISYSHADDDAARALLRDLKARDVSVWIDFEQLEPGDLFVRRLEQGMAAACNVLLLVSARSQASDWVAEEYANAMNLINGRKDAAARRLVPVLLDGAAPEGFLASRIHVDLRDPAGRGEALDRLAATLRGGRSRPRRVARDAAPAPVAMQAGGGIDEVQYLTRYIDRLREGAGRLRRARNWSPAVGAGLTAPAFWFFGEQLALQTIGALSGAAVTGLVGWGFTAYGLAASQRKVEALLNLRDGIELCRLRAAPMCEVLEQRFWTLVDGSSSAPPGAAP